LKQLVDSNEALGIDEIRDTLKGAAVALAESHPVHAKLCEELSEVRHGLQRESYPDDRGIVFTSRRRLHRAKDWYLWLPAIDDGEDDRSRTTRRDAVTLTDHTQHVRDWAERVCTLLRLNDYSDAILTAAHWHDIGKGDERFQAMLRRVDRTFASMFSDPIAKSDSQPQTARDRKRARDRAGLPDGFRHELLSMQLAEHDDPDAQRERRDLILHLIASHHGYARPFAPVVIDNEHPQINVNGIAITHVQRIAMCPPHRMDSGVGERFWRLTRCHGWWGLAYLEVVLRLADQQASACEDNEPVKEAPPSELAEVSR
jgi:CRISPR-associated endonuclease/helicase Cas3